MTLSLGTAYRSFGREVEASSTPTICRLPDSRRHQLWAIAQNRSTTAAIPNSGAADDPSAPGPVTDSTREPSRAGCILFSDGDRSTNCTGFRDISSELQEIRMRYDPVRDVDDEIVGGIAGTPFALRRQDSKIHRRRIALLR